MKPVAAAEAWAEPHNTASPVAASASAGNTGLGPLVAPELLAVREQQEVGVDFGASIPPRPDPRTIARATGGA